MIRHVTASRRFAQAAFEIATRDGTVAAWRKDLGICCQIASNADAVRAIDSPAVPFAKRDELLHKLLESRISELALRLCSVLAERGRFALLPQVSEEFDDLFRRSEGIVGATVTTPRPLSQADQAALAGKIEQMVGGKVELYTESDPRLIGGLCLQIGDLQIDASVQSRLDRLRKELVTGTS